MGMMDDAIKDTVKDKDFKKTDIKKLASRNKQVGGNHYNRYEIQPIDFIIANNLDWCEANAVKYITRWKDKNGVEDLRKAIHYLEMLIQREIQCN